MARDLFLDTQSRFFRPVLEDDEGRWYEIEEDEFIRLIGEGISDDQMYDPCALQADSSRLGDVASASEGTDGKAALNMCTATPTTVNSTSLSS